MNVVRYCAPRPVPSSEREAATSQATSSATSPTAAYPPDHLTATADPSARPAASRQGRPSEMRSCERDGAIGAHLLLVEQPVEEPIRRQQRIEQLVVLDRLGQRPGPRPVLLGEGGLPRRAATAFTGQLLHQQPAGAPGPGARA